MSHLIRVLSALSTVLMLVGCAAPKLPVETQGMFRDAAFKPSTQRIPASGEIMAASAEMRAYLTRNPEFLLSLRVKSERQALVDALYSGRLLKLEYESSTTRNASEAFAARSGNCLSLVIMTASLAHQLGLPVHYQTIFTDESESRSGSLYFLAGHVNLTLGSTVRSTMQITSLAEADTLTVDFVRPEALRGFRRMEVDERTIIAMYYNNRAAETLELGDVDDAYWWARAAVQQQPNFLAGLNTLAVIYRRHGDGAAAEMALREVLRHEPANVGALSNIVLVLRSQQRNAEADQFQVRLSELQPYPPFKFFDLGVEAMRRGEYAKARDLFERETARAAYYHEFRFWLALAEYALGDVKGAGKQLALAAENSPTRTTHDIYAAKLAWLQQHDKPKDAQPFSMQALPPGWPSGRSF